MRRYIAARFGRRRGSAPLEGDCPLNGTVGAFGRETLKQRFRLTVLGKPRGPWRATQAEALADAIALDLAAWNPDTRKYYLAEPCDYEMEMLI
jgi:hypothetical protein